MKFLWLTRWPRTPQWTLPIMTWSKNCRTTMDKIWQLMTSSILSRVWVIFSMKKKWQITRKIFSKKLMKCGRRPRKSWKPFKTTTKTSLKSSLKSKLRKKLREWQKLNSCTKSVMSHNLLNVIRSSPALNKKWSRLKPRSFKRPRPQWMSKRDY